MASVTTTLQPPTQPPTQPPYIAVVVIGVGLVGSMLLRHLADLPTPTPFRILGIASSRGTRIFAAEHPFTGPALSPDFTTSTSVSIDDMICHVSTCGGSVAAVVVDCTASGAIAECYPIWMRDHRVSIIAANKKGFSGSIDLYNAVLEAAKPPCRALHESSVGAGLPVLAALHRLVQSGERIASIEGVLSGTLSYIFNTFSPSVACENETTALAFSTVVRQARDNGFTEPDPRDDLNGVDVARKLVILSRAAQSPYPLDLATMHIASLVPAPLAHVSSDAYISRIAEGDADITVMRNEAAHVEKVLRYVGRVDCLEPSQSGVRLVAVPKSSPFATLRGSDNMVIIHTHRSFKERPLVIQGPGAGADVTAFGIVSDLFRLADGLL